VLVSSSVSAEDSMERRALRASSEASGLSKTVVPSYTRAAGPGRDVAIERLKRDLATASTLADVAIDVRTEQDYFEDDDQAVVKGPGWFLNVRGDGSRISYLNTASIDGELAPRVPVASARRIQQLEPVARRFITTALSGFVKLAANERLVAWKARHAISSAMTDGGRTMTERQVAATALEFRRVVDDSVVLGPGSRIEVMFAANGTVVGFDLDWAELRRSSVELRAAPVTTLQTRVSSQRAARAGASSDAVVTQKGLECGYYDAGYDAGAPLMPACVSAYSVDNRRTHLKAAYVDVVPADQAGAPLMPRSPDRPPPASGL
jgi:hypothetical protein